MRDLRCMLKSKEVGRLTHVIPRIKEADKRQKVHVSGIILGIYQLSYVSVAV